MLDWLRDLLQRGVTRNAPLLIGIAGGLLVGAMILVAIGVNPLRAYVTLFQETWGSLWAVTSTIQKLIPLAIIAVGLVICFRARVLNIGADGQLYVGGTAGALVCIYFAAAPAYVMLPLAFVAAFLGGMCWAFAPALLRARYRVDEVITTLMLNYVGFWLVDYLVRGPLTDPVTPGLEQSRPFAAGSHLPAIIPGTRITLALIIAVVAGLIVYVLMWRTRWGYEFRAVGVNPEAARGGGISLAKASFVPLLLSGGFAGLAGIIELAGVHGRLISGFSPGYGYTAIAVALLGRLKPVGVFLAGLLFATLTVGGEALQYDLRVPSYLSMVIQATIVIIVIAAESVTNRSGSA